MRLGLIVAVIMTSKTRKKTQLPALSPAPVAAPVEIWSEGLTAKQIAFVEHYFHYRNATQAYDAAFDARGGSYETRRDNGSRLLNEPHIQAALKKRYKIGAEHTGVNDAWLLNRFLAMAGADPRELIGLKVGCCRYCYGENHEYQWRQGEYVDEMKKVEWEANCYPDKAATLKWPDYAGGFGFNATWPPRGDCPKCHGEGVERFVPRDTDRLSDSALLLYGGVKVKADGGYEIIIADRAKAAELAGRILGVFSDKLKISGTVAHMHAVADLRGVDPIEAGKRYQEMISARLA